MTLDGFIQKYNGKGIDWDNYYGYQCYDLAHAYAVEVVGKDIPARPAAKDLWEASIEGYSKITNEADNFPLKGDIVVWGTGLSQWGHVAVAISGDTNSFTSFDQNFPLGTLCHIQQHNYTGVLGWFRPKVQITQNEELDDTVRATKVLREQFGLKNPGGNLEGWANALTQDAWPFYVEYKDYDFRLQIPPVTVPDAPKTPDSYTFEGLVKYFLSYVRTFSG